MRKFFKLTAAITAAATALSLAACGQKKVKTVSYEEAERSFLSGVVSSYSKFFALSEGVSKGDGGELTIEFTPEDYILELMGAGNINPTVFKIKSEVSEGDMYANIAYLNGKKELLNVEMWMEDKAYTLFIPALIDKYITGSLTEGAVASLTSAYTAGSPLSQNLKMPDPPSDAEVERVMNKLWDKYFELTKDAATEKNVDVTLGEVTLKCDKTTVEVDEAEIKQLAVTLLEEIKNSGEFMRFMEEIAAMQEDASTDISKQIDDAIAEINADSGTAGVLSMTVYINGTDIVKREVTVAENGVNTGFFSYAVMDDGKDYASESVFESYGEDAASVSVYDSGTKDGDVYTGSTVINVKSAQKSFTVNGSYSELSFDKDGNFNGGEITISSDDAADQSFSVKLKFNGDSFTGSLTVGSAKFATVKMTYNQDFDAPSAPSLDASNSVNVDGDSDALDEVGAQAGNNLMSLFATADDNGTYDIILYLLQQQMMGLMSFQ